MGKENTDVLGKGLFSDQLDRLPKIPRLLSNKRCLLHNRFTSATQSLFRVNTRFTTSSTAHACWKRLSGYRVMLMAAIDQVAAPKIALHDKRTRLVPSCSAITHCYLMLHTDTHTYAHDHGHVNKAPHCKKFHLSLPRIQC